MFHTHPALALATQSSVNLELHPEDLRAPLSINAGELTRLDPVKVSVNGPLGEVPSPMASTP